MPISFLELPRELRDQVYDELFNVPSCQKILPYRSACVCKAAQQHAAPELAAAPVHDLDIYQSLPFLRTCRTIYREGAPVFYSKNTFFLCDEAFTTNFKPGKISRRTCTVCDIFMLDTWLSTIGPLNASYIRSLCLMCTDIGTYQTSHHVWHPEKSKSAHGTGLAILSSLPRLQRLELVFGVDASHKWCRILKDTGMSVRDEWMKLTGLKELQIRLIVDEDMVDRGVSSATRAAGGYASKLQRIIKAEKTVIYAVTPDQKEEGEDCPWRIML